jgi:hypothetical protein
VNFSDPFGLCTIGKDCWKSLVAWFRSSVAEIDRQNQEFFKTPSGQIALGLILGGVITKAQTPNLAGSAVGEAALLARQLASEEALAEAQAGRGTVMAGAGAVSGRQIDDVNRLVATYGGKATEWAKMTTKVREAGGARISVHWYENIATGQRVEFKTPWDH